MEIFSQDAAFDGHAIVGQPVSLSRSPDPPTPSALMPEPQRARETGSTPESTVPNPGEPSSEFAHAAGPKTVFASLAEFKAAHTYLHALLTLVGGLLIATFLLPGQLELLIVPFALTWATGLLDLRGGAHRSTYLTALLIVIVGSLLTHQLVVAPLGSTASTAHAALQAAIVGLLPILLRTVHLRALGAIPLRQRSEERADPAPITKAPGRRLHWSTSEHALRVRWGKDHFERPVLILESSGEALRLTPLGIDEPGVARAVKRSMDIILASLLAVLVLPFLLLASLLVLMIDGWPILYRQERLTRGHRAFTMHKLRTMIRDAEPEGRAVWPTAEDPRMTRLGRWLRSVWIDELPQLYDVLRGSMSLIGPRPERHEFASRFTQRMPRYYLRCYVKAGITGLAQSRGYFGDTSIEERLALDLNYIREWSPRQDVAVFFSTCGRVLKRLYRSQAKRAN